MAEQKLFFDDIKEGDTGPEFSHELTRTDLVMYAGASGDFNPMHHDEVKAKDSGLPSVFGHGMFTAGILGKALTDFVGVGNLREYKVRFTKQTWPVVRRNDLPPFGERVPYVAAVVDLDEGPRMMTNVVDCEFDTLEVGMPLEVLFQETSEDVTIPVFRPRGAERADRGAA